MLAVARSYLPVQEDAEDVLQSALLLVVRFIHGFEGASRLSTWLHRIVVNAALMRIRSRDRHPEARWDDSVGGDSDSRFAVHLAASGKDELSRRELHERLHWAIARLPPNVRAAVRLRDMDGLTLGETSVLLGQSRESVKTSLRRGRIALRRMLSGGNGSAS
jgi:RNA polymerase sigma-70 factor (ECF subfamily)